MNMRRLRSAVAVGCLVPPMLAFAGSFSVSPVVVSLASDRSAGALTVRNGSQESTLMQLELMRWSQSDGTDQLEGTREILATPAIFTLPPGATQTVRVGLRGASSDARTERSYRLLLKEVLPEAPSDFKGLRVALQLSVPVFIEPLAAATPLLRWEARVVKDGLHLVAHNEGQVHVQVTGIGLGAATDRKKIQPAYVLPGQWKEWTVAHDVKPGEPIELTVRTDAGPLQARIVVSDH
ncbi:molecular chaperone [Xylophilus sp. GOD-11R]|uniref:fimbrial biogenesis chaperone n=1 Tax=Xylophilus sp. GOD-11R TaxID=3089814 RepID=UPI00298D53A9|nr:fimbria/pilus periplasmic chaperone [Xylophilus sp. GOD-11R]WPB59318.1 fimbria/pilus periplasmic chaperone [Xylophilus sp. GOD-11R]